MIGTRPRVAHTAPRTLPRVVGILLARTLAGALLALVLVLVVPYAVGGRPLVVLSGSMEPTLHVGDVVLAKRIAPLDARIGDIVTFHDPQRSGQLVTHRVRGISVQGAEVSFVTKGDANNATERWRVRTGDEIGRSVLRVPKIGYALSLLHTPTGLVGLVLLPLLALLVLELLAIWKPDRPVVDDAAR